MRWPSIPTRGCCPTTSPSLLLSPKGHCRYSPRFRRPARSQSRSRFIGLVYVAYIVGWRTKLAQILVVVCLLSLTNRNLVLQNGGIVVTNLVAIWTMFLPLGKRFSSIICCNRFARGARKRLL